MDVNALTLLHLSDIHLLGLEDDSTLDRDRELREALEVDVRALVSRHGTIDVLVLGGDIVVSGKPGQFNAATRWIEQLCRISGCDHTAVFCVPGNHDVDREMIAANGMIELAHRSLRTCAASEIDLLLNKALGADEQSDALLEPLLAYRAFAAQYDCPVEPERLRWKRQLPSTLAGRSVRLVGLNSALICDESDARTEAELQDDTRKVLLGTGQAHLHAPDESIVIAICHHPPHWLRDEHAVAPLLARAQLQLFGHEHQLEITPEDEHATVRIRAGAVQPQRDGVTAPSFNLLRVEAPDDHSLRVYVRARAFNDERRFAAVPDLADPEIRTIAMPTSGQPEESVPAPAGGPDTPPEPEPVADADRRETIWRLMQLTVDERRTALIAVDALSANESAGAAALAPALERIERSERWNELARRLDA